MTTTALKTLGADGLLRFQGLQTDAVSAVAERFFAEHGSVYARFGSRGRDACREDLAFHLEFLRPVLEFGSPQPMVDYLRWLDGVLAARRVPVAHLALSLDWLTEFFVSRMDAADGAVVGAALTAARTNFLDAAAAPSEPPSTREPWPETAPFMAALLAGNQREAWAVANRCLDSGRGLVDIELNVIQPALYEIGQQWQTNCVSVAHEHMATAIAQSVMTMGLLRSQPPAPVNRRALLACVEGNNHCVGLRMVADALLLDGWDVQYLGANVPTQSLVGHASQWKPDIVGLSVSFPQQLRAVKAIIALLDERLGTARPRVIIGGLAINHFMSLADMVGADAFSVDSRGALVYAKHVAEAQGVP